MDDYEARRSELEQKNLPLLRAFHGYLIDRRTGKRAAADHHERIEFFATHYLIDYHEKTLDEGYDEVADYLGYWFIRKAMWSDEKSMRDNLQSFRKFFDFLLSAGHIPEELHRDWVGVLDHQGPHWIRRVKRYNNPAIDPEDIWDDEDDPPEAEPEAKGGTHFVIMLSGFAAKHFKVRTTDLPKTDDLEGQGHWTTCWRCDLLAVHEASGTHYFILTNARTLYTVVVPDQDRRIESLVSVFAQTMALRCNELGLPWLEAGRGSFRLVRGQPRSLIGSQNELIRCALHFLKRPDPAMKDLCDDLNGVPMMALPEIQPEEAFRHCMQADPPGKIIDFPGPGSN